MRPLEQCIAVAQSTHGRTHGAWLAHGACKFYRWKQSYSITLRQLLPCVVWVRIDMIKYYTRCIKEPRWIVWCQMVHAASNRSFCPKYHSRAVLPARWGRESAMVPVPKQNHIDIVVLQFGNVVPFIFLFRMFCLGWQILARAQGVVLLLHPLATQTVGLQKVQLDGQDANAAKTLAQIDFALADLNFLAEQNWRTIRNAMHVHWSKSSWERNSWY